MAKLSVLLLVAFFITSACSADEAAKLSAPAEDSAFVYDFGKLKDTQSPKHEFRLKNDGTKILKIKDVNTSCGCTVSSVKKKKLAAGEETGIDVKFTAKGYNGPTSQFVYVHTDDPDHPVLRFVIKADVEK